MVRCLTIFSTSNLFNGAYINLRWGISAVVWSTARRARFNSPPIPPTSLDGARLDYLSNLLNRLWNTEIIHLPGETLQRLPHALLQLLTVRVMVCRCNMHVHACTCMYMYVTAMTRTEPIAPQVWITMEALWASSWFTFHPVSTSRCEIMEVWLFVSMISVRYMWCSRSFHVGGGDDVTLQMVSCKNYPLKVWYFLVSRMLDRIAWKYWRELNSSFPCSVPWSMERCCHFVDDLCRHDDLGVVFPSSVSLIPPGVNAASGNVGVVSAIRGVAPGKGAGITDSQKKWVDYCLLATFVIAHVRVYVCVWIGPRPLPCRSWWRDVRSCTRCWKRSSWGWRPSCDRWAWPKDLT